MSSDVADLILHTPTTLEGSVFQRVSPAGGSSTPPSPRTILNDMPLLRYS